MKNLVNNIINIIMLGFVDYMIENNLYKILSVFM